MRSTLLDVKFPAALLSLRYLVFKEQWHLLWALMVETSDGTFDPSYSGLGCVDGRVLVGQESIERPHFRSVPG